jgi:hypothetical protein
MSSENILNILSEPFVISKNCRIFAAAIERSVTPKTQGPFVYRLGRQIFILERGVRLPYGLQKNKKIKN